MVIDTNSSCRGKSAFLRSKEVTAIGRYYRVIRPEWALTKEEAAELSAAGIQIFTVYEDAGHLSKLTLTEDQGRVHGTNAVNQARIVGQPEGSAIYFALEGLPHGYNSSHLPAIREYFAGVSAVVDSRFQLGVYGDGVVCRTLLDESVCKYTWLAAASTSFEGTVDFHKSGRWNVAQIAPLDQKKGWDGMSVDVNDVNGDFGSFLVPIVVAEYRL